MTKMTNSVALQTAIDVLKADEKFTDVVEKLVSIKASIDKKNSHKSDNPTAKQKENSGFKEDILAFLEDGKKATITDIIKGVASLNELSNQRVTAIVRQMKEDNILKREEIKRKAYFSIKDEDENEDY